MGFKKRINKVAPKKTFIQIKIKGTDRHSGKKFTSSKWIPQSKYGEWKKDAKKASATISKTGKQKTARFAV